MPDQQGTDVDTRVAIPAPKALPKPETGPSYRPDTQNFADKEETVKKALGWARDFKKDFEGQSQWDEFFSEMDIADEMYRAAASRTELDSDQSNNVEDTRSNVKSSTYYSDIRIITAGQKAVILGSRQQLPVVYEPVPGAPLQAEEKALDIIAGYNCVLAYTFESDNIRPKLATTLLRTNKYGLSLIEMAWDYRKERRRSRKVKYGKPDENGGYGKAEVSWSEKEVVTADHPTYILHDMKDVGFDSMIPDIQNQSCLYVRDQVQQSELWAKRRTGEYQNVEKIGRKQLYQGENSTHDAKYDRQENAGETGDSCRPNGLFDRWRFFIRLPVDSESGKWGEEDYLSVWYEMVVIGDLDSDPVCVKLSPHWHGKIPFQLVHSHEDDKGAISFGYSTIVKSLIAQEMTCFDQAVDNNTLRNQKPWIIERGSISIRDKTFSAGGNRVWWKTPGALDPHEIEVQDTTGNTFNMLEAIKLRRESAMGVNKPFLGEPLGGRASASESIQVFEQAMKPALEDATFLSEQILPFVAYWNKELWDYRGDPEKVLEINYENQTYKVRPGLLWGDVHVRVCAIKQFQDSIIRRKEEEKFIAQIYPLMADLMSAKGKVDFFTQIARNRGFDDVDDWWAMAADYDARRVARSENMAIVWQGIRDMPKPEENHEAHMAEHEPYLSAIVLLPEDQAPPKENVMSLKLHLQLHENMKQKSATPGAAPTQLEAGSAGEPRTNGEAMGDLMGAEGGAEESPAPTALGGRPTEYSGQPGMEGAI